jgi:hypothetical protein
VLNACCQVLNIEFSNGKVERVISQESYYSAPRVLEGLEAGLALALAALAALAFLLDCFQPLLADYIGCYSTTVSPRFILHCLFEM